MDNDELYDLAVNGMRQALEELAAVDPHPFQASSMTAQTGSFVDSNGGLPATFGKAATAPFMICVEEPSSAI